MGDGIGVRRRRATVAGLAAAVVVLCVAGGVLLAWSPAAGAAWAGAAGGVLLCLGAGGGIAAIGVVTRDARGRWVLPVLVAAGIALALTAVPAYAGAFGRPAPATVAAAEPCADRGPLPAGLHRGGPECVGRARLTAGATGRDLGWTACAAGLRPGDTVEALVDPLGWLPPQRAACVLRGPAGAVPPAALALFAAALLALMTGGRPTRH